MMRSQIVKSILDAILKRVIYPSRAEKERSQYFSEVNDLRAGVDHLSNEKVDSDIINVCSLAGQTTLRSLWQIMKDLIENKTYRNT